ncbi:hypothetical protein SAMN05216192_15310 [Paenibacillus typhae]|uniref:Uncharacterized protein n=1 Tax=Paenibacillus typhae TaxID=1174501 RepID=A0A1G9EGP1_9BACL|nr:hypothetical protein SAMN05216192_15310 [Paenibacillus typhae]
MIKHAQPVILSYPIAEPVIEFIRHINGYLHQLCAVRT